MLIITAFNVSSFLRDHCFKFSHLNNNYDKMHYTHNTTHTNTHIVFFFCVRPLSKLVGLLTNSEKTILSTVYKLKNYNG